MGNLRDLDPSFINLGQEFGEDESHGECVRNVDLLSTKELVQITA